MKKLIKVFAIALPVIAVLAACKKDYKEAKATYNPDLESKATVQLYNAVLSSKVSYLYVDFKSVTGANITYGAALPTGSSAIAVDPGMRNFLFKDTTNPTIQTALSLNENLSAKTAYTIFAYDTVNAAKAKMVTTDLSIPADTTAKLRFANMAYHRTAPQAVDIYSVKRGANVFTNVAAGDVTAFIPYASALNDTFYVRPAGTTNNLTVRTSSTATPTTLIGTLTPTRKRSYTLVFRGSYLTDITSSAVVRSLVSFTNH
jgi:hypothetical protein